MKMAQVRRFFCLLSVLLVVAAPSVSAALKDYPFRLVTQADGDQEEVIAENKGPSPITVLISLNGKNVSANRTFPATAVVPPQAALPLAVVSAADPAQPYDYTLSYSYYVGRIDATPDPQAPYRLPFEDGLAFPITQAYGTSLTSHSNVQNRYAVDFAMPEGTAIVAARDGVVVDVTLNYRAGGFNRSLLDMANTVTIVHDDGTIAEYAHLAPGTPLVQRGERVRAGSLIAYSGNTGYSSAPHLHFVVSKPGVRNGKLARISIPVVFYADDPPVLFSPETGMVRAAVYGEPMPETRAAVAATVRKMQQASALPALGAARTNEVQELVPAGRR
jgi:murein DD-endopeptidase MepM/ murein hydrolase activator NlpD